jgi:hypothetical protein
MDIATIIYYTRDMDYVVMLLISFGTTRYKEILSSNLAQHEYPCF